LWHLFSLQHSDFIDKNGSFYHSFVAAYSTVLGRAAFSSKHEPVRSVTENIVAIFCSTSTSQQQFLLFSVICHKQISLHS
jgi:hypothetical protein